MQTALRVKTTVLPNGKIEIFNPQLLTGETVEVIILFSPSPILPLTQTKVVDSPLLPQTKAVEKRPALDILAEAEGQRLFKTAEEVDSYLQKERNTWEN